MYCFFGKCMSRTYGLQHFKEPRLKFSALSLVATSAPQFAPQGSFSFTFRLLKIKCMGILWLFSEHSNAIPSYLDCLHCRPAAHTYIVKNERPPRCELCESRLTVAHILIECNRLAPARNRFYRARSMRDLFTNIDPSIILSFLKEIKVYDKL